jgi:hypothetical protein
VSLTLSISTRPPQACGTCLPQTELYVEQHDYLVGAVAQVSPEVLDDYMGVMDWLLATFVPDLRPNIWAYYNDEQPNLKGWLPEQAIAKIDQTVLGTLQQLEAAA